MNDTLDFTVQNDSVADVDLLKDGTHQKIADRLFDLITKSETKGLTIGLEGSWGSGKSTVINLLRKRLEEKNDTFVFYIDSWAHEGDYLRRAFLESFAQQLEKNNVKGEELEEIKNRISNRIITKNTTTKPVVNLAGAFCSILLVFAFPIGLLFIDKGVEHLWKGDYLQFNDYLTFGLVLSLSPIFAALLFCLINFIVNLVTKDKKKSILPIFWSTDTTENTTDETTEEPEKTPIEFENYFEDLLEITKKKGKKKIVCVIDNLDRINSDDALKIWSTLQIFVQFKNPKGSKQQCDVWIIVPYDEAGLRLLWDNKGSLETGEKPDERVLCSKSFFDKSFQLRIEVPKMLFEGWEDYAKKIIENSLKGLERIDKEIVLETLKRGRKKISDAPSPREIKTYVNQVGLLYDLHRKNNISLVALCFYVDLKYLHSKSEKVLKDELIAGRILPENQALGLFNDRNEIAKELCGIVFNVDAEKGIELLLENPVIDALEKDDVEEMKKLTRNHENAVLTFVEKILAENRYNCKNYISLLLKVFGTRIENTLLKFVSTKQDYICDQMRDITSIENLCSIFQIVKGSADNILLSRLSETYTANQHERLKSGNEQSTIDDVVKSYESVYVVVNDSNLIYIDYNQLGIDCFQQLASAVKIEKMPIFGRFIKKVDLLDEHYSKKIDANSPDLTSLPLQLVHLGCCAGCLQWNNTLNAINNLVIVKPNYNLNTEGFVQCVMLISVLQEYDLKSDLDIIKTLLNKPVFWHYISASKKDVVIKIAAYLLAKYYDDLNLPQMQHVGQSPNGIDFVKAVFEKKNDDVIKYFCKKVNATKKNGFIWALARHSKYQLIGGIIEKQLKDEQHWFFKTGNPFEFFANAILYFDDDDNTRNQILNEFISQSNLIYYIKSTNNVNMTNHIQACKMLLESEYSTDVVDVVKRELETKKKDEWLTALEQDSLILDVVRKCSEITNQSLDELTNDYADGIVEYIKSKRIDEKIPPGKVSKLCSLYSCMNESFKTYVSDKIATDILENEFVFSSNLKDLFAEWIDFNGLTNKAPDVAKIIKKLVDGKNWIALENALLIIKKCEALEPPQHYTDVMRQPLKDLDTEATLEQKQIVDGLCEFFNIDPNSIRSTETPEENSES